MSNRTSIQIRRAIASDAANVAAIYNYYVDSGGATFDAAHQTLSAVVARIETPPPDGWYVAERSGEILGWTCARRYSERHGYRLACETAIYLVQAATGAGIADQLQQRIDQHCIEYHLHHAVARVIADNHRSLRFHYSHGYELVGIQKEIGRVNDRWVDVAILQKLYPETLMTQR